MIIPRTTVPIPTHSWIARFSLRIINARNVVNTALDVAIAAVAPVDIVPWDNASAKVRMPTPRRTPAATGNESFQSRATVDPERMMYANRAAPNTPMAIHIMAENITGSRPWFFSP